MLTSLAQTRAKKTIKPTNMYIEASYALLAGKGDPSYFQEAIESNKWQGWMGAMSEEMKSLHKNSVWELVLKPKDRKIIVDLSKERKHKLKGGSYLQGKISCEGVLTKGEN